MRTVGGRYLILHRENYLEEGGEIRDFVRELSRSIGDGGIQALLDDVGWRAPIVGVHCVIAARRRPFFEAMGNRLVVGRIGFLRQPICLALTFLGGGGAADSVAAFLDQPYDEEAFYEYAAALEAIERLRPASYGANSDKVLSRLSVESYYDAEAFQESRERFAAALKYWSE